MQVRPIEYDSPAYRQELELRNRLLRLPLGLDVYDEPLELEREQWHFGLFDGDTLIGCAVAVPRGSDAVQIRQMAIETAWQRMGNGRRLLESVEQLLLAHGVQNIMLHSRIEAIGFYDKLGYEVVGAEFVEVGIAHREMKKELESN